MKYSEKKTEVKCFTKTDYKGVKVFRRNLSETKEEKEENFVEVNDNENRENFVEVNDSESKVE